MTYLGVTCELKPHFEICCHQLLLAPLIITSNLEEGGGEGAFSTARGTVKILHFKAIFGTAWFV